VLVRVLVRVLVVAVAVCGGRDAEVRKMIADDTVDEEEEITSIDDAMLVCTCVGIHVHV